MKTLLYCFISLSVLLSSCSTSSKTYSSSSYKKSKSYKKPASKSRSYSSNNSSAKRKNSAPKSTRSSAVTQKRTQITSYAEVFKGTPYVYGGKNTSGFDCSGFITHVYNKQGIKLHGNSKTLATLGKRKSIHACKAGDLIFFGKQNKVSHVAIVVTNKPGFLEVIHATSSRGVVRENIAGSSYWTPRILFAADVLASNVLAD